MVETAGVEFGIICRRILPLGYGSFFVRIRQETGVRMGHGPEEKFPDRLYMKGLEAD